MVDSYLVIVNYLFQSYLYNLSSLSEFSFQFLYLSHHSTEVKEREDNATHYLDWFLYHAVILGAESFRGKGRRDRDLWIVGGITRDA